VQDWLNRVGLILQFLAVWFVTPQIIGEDLLLKAGESLSTSADEWSETMKLFRGISLVGFFILLVIAGIPLIAANALRALHHGVFHSIGTWLGWTVVGLEGLVLAAFLVGLLAVPVMSGLSRLIKASTRSARRLLVAGAMLFSTGFAVLLAATWTRLSPLAQARQTIQSRPSGSTLSWTWGVAAPLRPVRRQRGPRSLPQVRRLHSG
jgi:hypothetical protein